MLRGGVRDLPTPFFGNDRKNGSFFFSKLFLLCVFLVRNNKEGYEKKNKHDWNCMEMLPFSDSLGDSTCFFFFFRSFSFEESPHNHFRTIGDIQPFEWLLSGSCRGKPCI